MTRRSSRWTYLGLEFHFAFWLLWRFAGLHLLVDGLIIVPWTRQDASPWKALNAQRLSLAVGLRFQTHWLPQEVPRLRSAFEQSVLTRHYQTRQTGQQTNRWTLSFTSFCTAIRLLFLLGCFAPRWLSIPVRRVLETVLVRAQSTTSRTTTKNESHHGRKYGVFDKRFVCRGLKDILLETIVCRQFAKHDAHGQLAEGKMHVKGCVLGQG